MENNTASICPSCPICKKSLGDYSGYWRAIDREVASVPVPDEYRGWQTNILCNDCSTSSTVPYSMIAHKCRECGSYNTRRMGIITGSGEHQDAQNEPTGAASLGVLGAIWNEGHDELWVDALEEGGEEDGEEGEDGWGQ